MKIPDWLVELAADSDKRLSALPLQTQPGWYRQNITQPRVDALREEMPGLWVDELMS